MILRPGTYFALLIVLMLSFTSCRIVHVYKSETVIVSRSFDMSLNDSVYISGYTYEAESNKMPEKYSRLWVEGSPVETWSDSAGFYSLKLTPGRYSIHCSRKYGSSSDDAILKDLSVLPNEKLEIDFHIGFTAE